MAFNIGELVWKITGDTSQIEKSVKNTETRAQKLGNTLKAAFSVASIAIFGKAVFDLGRRLVGLASDAEETANKFSVVFDGLSDASDVAEELADSYGLSAEASQNLLSSTADLLQGFGVAKDESLELSRRTQELAVDLASFSNFAGGAAGASQALTSALLGEREAVKALGIAITDAELKRFAEEQGEVFDELTKGEKAILTLELAYKQSANAVGDFERSQESFANQTRIAQSSIEDLSASIGEQLLPAATKALTKVNELLAELERTREIGLNAQEAIKRQAEGEGTLADEIARRTFQLERGNIPARRRAELEAELANLIRQQATAQLGLILTEERQANARAGSNDVTEESIELSAEEIAANEELLRQQELLALQREEQAAAEFDRVLALRELRREASEREIEEAQARAEAREEEARREIAARKETAAFSLSLAQDTFGNIAALAEEGSTAQKAALIATSIAERGSSAFNAFLSTQEAAAKALTAGPILGPILAGIIKTLGGVNIAAILAKPLPKLQDGGIIPARPSGTTVIAGEAGVDEAIVPLDEGGFGTMRIVVNLDGQPIIDRTQTALNNREIIVDAGSIS